MFILILILFLFSLFDSVCRREPEVSPRQKGGINAPRSASSLGEYHHFGTVCAIVYSRTAETDKNEEGDRARELLLLLRERESVCGEVEERARKSNDEAREGQGSSRDHG